MLKFLLKHYKTFAIIITSEYEFKLLVSLCINEGLTYWRDGLYIKDICYEDLYSETVIEIDNYRLFFYSKKNYKYFRPHQNIVLDFSNLLLCNNDLFLG